MPGLMALQQFQPTSVPLGGFAGSMTMPSSVQPAIPQPSASIGNVGQKDVGETGDVNPSEGPLKSDSKDDYDSMMCMRGSLLFLS
ncbi:hypothetical protein LIER_22216 [Lithospermum erythrorhizon]|uniref:Uncharacterized protein n=1 Tax=Lithospermum erythrorhizon TaxID=34254 RepID=A0AAV3QT27_LITER